MSARKPKPGELTNALNLDGAPNTVNSNKRATNLLAQREAKLAFRTHKEYKAENQQEQNKEEHPPGPGHGDHSSGAKARGKVEEGPQENTARLTPW